MDDILQARDYLIAQFMYHPDVTLIDVGYPIDQDQKEKIGVEGYVLRIHLRSDWFKNIDEKQQIFPEQVNNIPVILIPADYQLE